MTPIHPPRKILNRRQVAEAAARFLADHHPSLTIPVPIEQIADVGLGIAVVPGAALRDVSQVDAYLTGDLQEICVDAEVYMHPVPHRLRFSIAHELAHAVLHSEAYTTLLEGCPSIGEYKKLIRTLDEKDLGFIEWQAYEFAGQVLVPPTALADVHAEECARLGVSPEGAPEGEKTAVHSAISTRFEVSPEVVRRRCEADGLWA